MPYSTNIVPKSNQITNQPPYPNSGVFTVKPDFSWDIKDNLATTLVLPSPYVSVTPDTNGKYTCYAPFAAVSVISTLNGDTFSVSTLSAIRTINFNDYYNPSDSNLVEINSGKQYYYETSAIEVNPTELKLKNLEVKESTSALDTACFFHTYVMPGTYTIDMTTQLFNEVNKSVSTIDENVYVQDSAASSTLTIPKNVPGFRETVGITHEKNLVRVMENTTIAEGGNTPVLFLDPLNTTFWSTVALNDTISGTGIAAGSKITEINKSLFYIKIDKALTANLLPIYTKTVYSNVTEQKEVTKVVTDVSTTSTPSNKTVTIEVLELPPKIILNLVANTTVAGTRTLTGQFTVRDSTCGSFPIEKVEWDMGDGSAKLEQIRWKLNTALPFVANNVYTDDTSDPRNYDVKYTYTLKPDEKRSFIVTAKIYAANTGTFVTATYVFPPVEGTSKFTDEALNTSISTVNLIQSHLTDNGKVIVAEINNNIVAWSTNK